MSLKLGGSKSKTKTTSNSTYNHTTTPTVPDWGAGPVQAAAGRVGGLLGQDAGSFVAPANGLQVQAANGAGNLSGMPWNFDAAADLTRGAADTSWLTPHLNAAAPAISAGRARDHLNDYLNPYLQEVVDTTAADFDAHAGNVRAQQALDLAGAGAFGGSGAALTQSMTEGELARGRASALAGLRSQAFQTALGAASADADRLAQASVAGAQTALQDRAQRVNFGLQGQQQQLQAAGQLTDLSQAYEANQRANIATQAQMGEAMRGIDQQQRQAPITHAQQIVAMLSGLPINLFVGEQKSGTESSVGTSKTKSSDWGLSISPSDIGGWQSLMRK